MKKFIGSLFVFSLFMPLASCTIYQKCNPNYRNNTIAVGYSESGSYLNTGYYTGYAYEERKNWYGVSYPSGYNNSIWYAHE